MKTIYRFVKKLRPSRTQRLLLFGLGAIWFLIAVRSVQRNYQDNWILDGVFWPFIGYLIIFLLVLWMENDNKWVAVICACNVIILSLVPSLKYVQVYGQATDQVMHYQMINSLISTGRVSLELTTYRAIAGMHSWLASMGITSGLSASVITKIGFSLEGGILPLLIYWLCKGIKLPSDLTKWVLSLSCLAIFTFYVPTGTGFSLVPVILFLGALFIREHSRILNSKKVSYTLVALIVLFQLTIWHSTTPFILLLILVGVSLTPVLVWLIEGRKKRVSINTRFLRIDLLACVLIIGYHTIEVDPVFKIVFIRLYSLILAENDPASIIPASTYQLQIIDTLRVFILMYGRESILFILSALGLAVIWYRRDRLGRYLYFFSFLAIICALFVVAIPLSLIGLDFKRLIWIPLTFSPFFAAFFLWRWNLRLEQSKRSYIWIIKIAGYIFLLLAISIFVIEFYVYQPLVPKSKSLTPDTPNEYVTWIHHVNTAYQQRMITFAESHSNPDTRFDVDIYGNRQYIRYYAEVQKRGLYLPLAPFMGWTDHRNSSINKLFLLHWPGVAGGFAEQVQYRSVKYLTSLRDTPGWGLIYDNGESFILLIPGSYP